MTIPNLESKREPPDALADANAEIDRLTLALHAARRHPDFEYATTQNARKSGEAPRPDGDGWEENICERRADGTLDQHSCWERFDFHEDNYWRRLRPSQLGTGGERR